MSFFFSDTHYNWNIALGTIWCAQSLLWNGKIFVGWHMGWHNFPARGFLQGFHKSYCLLQPKEPSLLRSSVSCRPLQVTASLCKSLQCNIPPVSKKITADLLHPHNSLWVFLWATELWRITKIPYLFYFFIFFPFVRPKMVRYYEYGKHRLTVIFVALYTQWRLWISHRQV